MRSLIKKPREGWKVTEIQNELEALQQAVGGRLESVSLWADACVLCNEEGRIKGLPYNTTICGVSFVGPILIVGTAGEDFFGPHRAAGTRPASHGSNFIKIGW